MTCHQKCDVFQSCVFSNPPPVSGGLLCNQTVQSIKNVLRFPVATFSSVARLTTVTKNVVQICG